MAKRVPSALTYAVTIRKIGGYLIVSVKDWGMTFTIDWEDGDPYTNKIRTQLITTIEKAWLRVAEQMKLRLKSGIDLPDPSKIALATEKEKKKGRQVKPLTVSEVSKILGCSENSVRRISKTQLPFKKSKGGHRRYAVGAVLKYQELYDWKGPLLNSVPDNDNNSSESKR